MGAQQEAKRAALATLAAAPAPSALAAPLEFLAAEHARQRALCVLVECLAEAPAGDARCRAVVLRYLGEDFAAHVRDEEDDLFPLLRARAERDDGIDEVLARLGEEHDAGRREAAAIVDLLSGRGRPLSPHAARERLLHFAARERRHLVAENAILLPLARARLRPGDLDELARRMAARRGLAYEKIARPA